MVNFEKKKCVLARSENRESGPTASVKMSLKSMFHDDLALDTFH